ncbi:Hypothetical Protein FCC1311_074872 [Hondaea fermentalgiana]|uniref:Uncharacterized protein n=1 Tax=Hondaea fermentalgiana TaxID=2315210 RepID=A0A2R5GK31_9STRA|nr:Hypothetical Protein FCC1311_074872 [Hondaea fermentalgiana]|eukprot:GBG31266.1 Hypothetical Protein FCC1311_074872 [Hondaea fermentalgiana]
MSAQDHRAGTATLLNLAVCMYSKEMPEDAIKFLSAAEASTDHFRAEKHLNLCAAHFKRKGLERALFHAQSAVRFAQIALTELASQNLPACFSKEAIVLLALAYHSLGIALVAQGYRRSWTSSGKLERERSVTQLLEGVKWHIKAYEEVALAHKWAVPGNLTVGLWLAFVTACRRSFPVLEKALDMNFMTERSDLRLVARIVLQQTRASQIQRAMRASLQLPGFALRRSEELSAEDFRLYDAFHKATGHGYMSTTELWQRRLSLGSSTGTRSDDNPEPKQSDAAAERQRRVSRSMTSASREVSRFEAERLEQARRQQLEREPTVEEERRFRKLMRKDTATTSGRKRLLHKFSSGPAFAHQDEMYPGKLDLDVGSWVSASEPGPSPDTKEQGKPYFHMVSTATEGAHTWGTTWGTRDQANAAWVGPDHDVVSPIDNSAWASRDSKCEEDDTDDGNAFLYSRPPKRTPKLSRGSKQILKSHPEQRKPILEHSKMWAARQKQRREHGDSDGFDGNAAATRPRTAGHERYAMLRRRSIVAQQAESAEAESLMSLVATLPDGFRENVVKMIDTLPTPALAASRGEKGSAKSSMPASPRCTNIDRHWAHDDLVQEHADLHGHDEGEATSSPASPSGTSRDKPHGKVAKKAVYRPDAINSHVERLCEFRKRQHQKAQAAERAFQASGWTPETTVQKPFHLSSATRKASQDRALGRTTGSSSSSTPPFAKIPADERKLLDEIESEIERSILLSASERSMEESKQPDLFRSAADIDRFLEASV